MQAHPKLLHICSYSWETGGPSSFIYNHSKFQVSKGVRIDIASAMYPWQNTYDVPEGVVLHEFPKSFFSRFISEFSWSMIRWFLKHRNHYDVIHVHGLWHFGSILPFLIPSRAKKVVTIHGFLDSYVMQQSGIVKKMFWVLFQKRFLQKADKLHAMNEEEYDLLINLFPKKSSAIELIGNGIEDPLQKTFGTPNNSFIQLIEQFLDSSKQAFLFLSRKSAKKGIDLLLAAFAEMSKNPDWNGQLILAGPVDDYSKEITSFIAQNPSLQILELPLVSGAEKDYLYKKSNYVVLPSYSEGFSIAALEALAYGKCCILSNRIGFSQLVEKEQAALVFEPTYPKLLQQFKKVSAENFDANRLRQSARKLYLENFQSLDISNKLFHFIFVKNM